MTVDKLGPTRHSVLKCPVHRGEALIELNGLTVPGGVDGRPWAPFLCPLCTSYQYALYAPLRGGGR
jgi:hypothetical protein